MKLVGVLEENEGEETDIKNTVSTVNSCSVSASNNNKILSCSWTSLPP